MKAIFLLSVSLLAVVATAQDFDFFYFVQQWPGSYCDTKRGCCYPTTGKPASTFAIHGFWPNYNDGSYPSNCDPDSLFDPSKIEDLLSPMQQNWPAFACPSSDGLSFWEHEWEKHGTCSESVLDQHSYFHAALNLHNKSNIIQALQNAGIYPNGDFYSVESIKEAIKESTGFTPGLVCNVDEARNSQLFQVYLCADSSGKEFIECPVYSRWSCSGQVEFPEF